MHLPANYPVKNLPSVSGGGLPGKKFNFAQLHFHWASDHKKGGSEHLIGSKRYSAEMHLVHFNDKYGTLAEAVKHEDGLAVLGVFLDIQGKNDNVPFRHFVDLFSLVKTEGQETAVPHPIPLMDLLPDSVDDFYRYQGSLTTPQCNEIVTWTLFATSISLSEKQVRLVLIF